jgi:hypothetical protein
MAASSIVDPFPASATLRRPYCHVDDGIVPHKVIADEKLSSVQHAISC